MLKRIWLIILMNAAILIIANLFLYILSLFWVNVNYASYGWLFIFCLVASFVGSTISLFISKWLAKTTYWVRIVTQADYNSLSEKEKLVFDVVKDLSERNHIKMPEVGIYQSDEPNAFATWATKNSSLVAVSSGLLDSMSKEAIEWVVWHEMAHVLNGDMVTMTILQWILDTFVMFFAKVIARIVSNFVDEQYATWVRIWLDIVLQIVFWILASFIAMWFSRYREYKADAGSAYYVGKEKMIAWLQALKDMQNKMHEADPKYASMQISAPNSKWLFSRLLSSHPELDDRIKALEDLKI